MNNITIKEDSKLYRFFELVKKTPLGGAYIRYNNDGILNSFNDICTFVRHFLLSIFIVIPFQLLVLVVGVFIALYSVVYLPLEALYYSIFGEFDGTPIGTGLLYAYIGLIILYLSFCVLQYIGERSYSIAENVEFKMSDTNPIKQAYTIISQKHSKFCQRLSVKTREDERREAAEEDVEEHTK